MIVSLTQYRQLAKDQDGNVLPIGKDRLACEARTTAGAFAALNADTSIVRIATDTAIRADITGGTTDTADELFPAGVEWIAVNGGEIITIAVA